MLNYFFDILCCYLITISILGLIFFVFIKKILFIKNEIFITGLFTNSNKTASIVEIAQSISKYYKIEPSRMHFLLLQGFWNGSFDKVSRLNRFNILKNILYDKTVKNIFVWHYLDDTPPITSKDLPDGNTEYDIKPLLTVPSKNTTNSTVQNCNEAFKTLSKQPIYVDEIYPKYITPLIRPAFMSIKISQKDLNRFLLKNKIILKNR